MKHLEEDFERLSLMDKMYLIEAERQMIEDWENYEAYQKRKPAEIEVKVKKYKYEKSSRQDERVRFN